MKTKDLFGDETEQEEVKENKDSEEVRKLKHEIVDLEKEVEELRDEVSDLEDEPEELRDEIQKLEDDIWDLDQKIFPDNSINDQLKVDLLQDNWEKITLDHIDKLIKSL